MVWKAPAKRVLAIARRVLRGPYDKYTDSDDAKVMLNYQDYQVVCDEQTSNSIELRCTYSEQYPQSHGKLLESGLSSSL